MRSDGRRIAYATLGEGPLLLFGGRWVTHLEEEWDDPRARAFFEDLAEPIGSCATTGSGPASRIEPARTHATIESELETLAAVHEA